MPSHGAIDTGDHTGAAFEATRILHDHLSFLIQGIEIGRAGIDAEPFFAGMASLLIEVDMGLLVVLNSVEGQLFGDLHRRSAQIFLNCHQSFNVSILKKAFLNSAILVL